MGCTIHIKEYWINDILFKENNFKNKMSILYSKRRQKELFTLSVLRYNMKMNEFCNKKKYNEYKKQVDIQEFYLFRKHHIFPGYKSEKNIIDTLNHLSKIFYHPNSSYTVYNNGFIFRKEKKINHHDIKKNLEITFPKNINELNLSYTKVNYIEYLYLDLHFLLLKSL